MITSRAVGAVQFKAKDDHGDFCISTLENVYYVPHKRHNFVTVRQFTYCAINTWDYPDFKTCTCRDAAGLVHPFTFAHNELAW